MSTSHVHDAPATPSTVGSILVDPPHTATILNHTRVPVLHGRLHEGSNSGQPTAMATTTRVSRIPRGRRSLQIPSEWRTSTSETYSSSVSPTEPETTSTLTPAYGSGALRSGTNAADRLSPHLSPKDNATFSPAPMGSAHRRSASYGSSRPISGNGAVRAARVKGFKSESVNKENIISTMENPDMRPLSSFVLVNASEHPKSSLPMTPSRERVLLSSYPSPASSTELSPLGQKMMADLRKQRQVRGERRRSRFAESTNTHL